MSLNLKKLASSYTYWPEIQNPYHKSWDFSNAPITALSQIETELLKKPAVELTDEIIRFYALNHYLAQYRKTNSQVLDKDGLGIYKAYLNEIEGQSKRILSYFFTSCITEAMHNHDFTGFHDPDEGIPQKYLKNLASSKQDAFKKFYFFMINIRGTSSFNDRKALSLKILRKIQEDPVLSKISIGDMFFFIDHLFQRGKFSSSYAGKPWKNINNHAYKFVTGMINAEVFIDQAYSLEHNGGNVFDKKHLYKNSSKTVDFEIFHSIRKLDSHQVFLNMQHLGMILDFISFDFKKVKVPSSTQFNNNIKNIINTFNKLNTSFKKSNPDFILNNLSSTQSFQVLAFFELLQAQERNNGIGRFTIDTTIKDLLTNLDMVLNAPKIKTPDYVPQPIFHFIDLQKDLKGKKEKIDPYHLGSKAISLVNMKQMGLPVPQAWVFPTSNCALYCNNPDKWKKEFKNNFNYSSIGLKSETLFTSDEHDNPKLYSVRSGAVISMPGMMDTILNVGFGSNNWDYFCKNLTFPVAKNCYSKFIHLFTKSFLNAEIEGSKDIMVEVAQFKKLLKKHHIKHNPHGLFPLSPQEQIEYSIEAVFKSWFSNKAQVYRKHHHISDNLGTACILQDMVLGNLNHNSCTGVLFSRDCINGNNGIIGEFLIKAQGEDVVSGSKTPLNIQQMKDWNKGAYNELCKIAKLLEKSTGEIQDIEFTVEDGKLYILQSRKAVCSKEALIKFKIEQLKEKIIDEEELIKSLPSSIFTDNQFIKTENTPLSQGLSANPGIIQGYIVKNEADIKQYSGQGKLIFFSKETTPEHAPLMLKTDGFITQTGGFTSHAAILARSWDKPCVVNIGNKPLVSGQKITLDANEANIYNGFLDISVDLKKIKNIQNIINDYYAIDSDPEIKTKLEQQLNTINQLGVWMPIDQKLNKKFKKEKNKHFLDLVNKMSIFIIQHQKLKDNAVTINQVKGNPA